MKLLIATLRIFVLTIFLVPLAAKAAPPQLYNKTVEIYWGETFVSKRVSDGSPSTGIGKKTRIIYVSSAGRAFVKSMDTSGRHNSAREKGPEDAKGNVSFSGSQLVLTMPNKQIARRIVASFDSSFSTCAATIVVGKNSNARSIGYDGAEYDVISITAGDLSCSVKQGNSLVGQ